MTKYQMIRTAQYMLMYYHSKSKGLEKTAVVCLDQLPWDFLADEDGYIREVSEWLMSELKKEARKKK